MKQHNGFDTHVACQGMNISLHGALVDIGFQDDGFVGRYVSMIGGVPVSSCPLIGIHMSKKDSSRDQSLYTLEQTRKLVEQYQMVGYGHSEVTLSREIISRSGSLDTRVRPSFSPLQPSSSDTDKKWDVHIAIPKVHLDDTLREAMETYGFDWIDLQKSDENTSRVYSAQGICNLNLGQELYSRVITWLKGMNVPSAKIKLEAYVGMYRIGNPEIIPPVVETVKFVA